MKFSRVAPGVEDLTGSATLSSILRCFRWKKWGSSLVQVSARSLHHVTGIKCQKNLIRHRRPKEAKTQNEHRRYSNSQSRYSDYYLELFICFLHVGVGVVVVVGHTVTSWHHHGGAVIQLIRRDVLWDSDSARCGHGGGGHLQKSV